MIARAASLSGIAALLLSTASSCAAEAPPFETTYSVLFPSTEAAVATETLEVAVFEAKKQDECQSLFEKRRTEQDLPNPLFYAQPLSTCDVFENRGGVLRNIGFGRRAFLVIGKRNKGEDFLVGCEVQSVTDGSPPVTVHLTLVDPKLVVPPTDCARLSEFCNGGC